MENLDDIEFLRNVVMYVKNGVGESYYGCYGHTIRRHTGPSGLGRPNIILYPSLLNESVRHFDIYL